MKAQGISPSLKSTLKDDMRKEILKSVKPQMKLPDLSLRQTEVAASLIQTESLEEFSKKYRKGSGGEEFESKYKISPNLTRYTGRDPVNKLPDGYVIPVFNGGKWEFANPSTRVDGLIFPSGLNLSGGGKKKMSAKAKLILQTVFGMEVDD